MIKTPWAAHSLLQPMNSAFIVCTDLDLQYRHVAVFPWPVRIVFALYKKGAFTINESSGPGSDVLGTDFAWQLLLIPFVYRETVGLPLRQSHHTARKRLPGDGVNATG